MRILLRRRCCRLVTLSGSSDHRDGHVRYGIVLFDTTQAAIRAEKVLDQVGIRTKLIPVPRHISANCGISLRFDLVLAGEVKSELASNSVPISAILPLENSNHHTISTN